MAADQPERLKDKTRPTLARAAATYQERVVIPHCAVCTRPCCKLDELVLELDWKQTQKLYQIGGSRRAFDRSLHEGAGPEHIKESYGRYFAHGKPCPAYDDEKKNCRVYGTDTKPEGCSDFPVYKDGDVVTADLRCEAVKVDELQAHLETETGRPVAREVDPTYPFFVSFKPRRSK